MRMILLECKGLSKRFGRSRVLDTVSISVTPKEIFGLLGPNGAGKTTLIKCIMGLIQPSSGEVFFNGRRMADNDIQQSFSYLPESFQLFRELNAYEILGLIAKSLGKRSDSAQSALEKVGLADVALKRVKAYSRGMQQRLGLAVCLMKDPQVIVLDDPFLGLDIVGQVAIIEIIKELKAAGKTIIFSSHTLAQVEKIIDAVAVIDKGIIRFQGRVSDFIAKHGAVSLEKAFLEEIGYAQDMRTNPA